MILMLLILIVVVAFQSDFTIYSDPAAKQLETKIDDKDLHLVIDAINEKVLPKHFRKACDPISTDNEKPLNLTGLDTLNISGSHQFSEEGLKLIKESIGAPYHITDIDLRQESHGFINGNDVSWANAKNNANEGLTKQQVIGEEKKKLKSIPLNQPISFYNHPKITIVPKKVQTEEKLVKSHSISYLRIPVTDGKLPNDEMVDYFVGSVRKLPENAWLHFHCKEGIGRTTTFMIMYDMMKNAKEVSSEDIIRRQVVLAHLTPHSVESFYSKERINFLNTFYQYCKENTDNFKTKWSQWKQKQESAYIKSSKKPKFLYVIDQKGMNSPERTMIATLQGLVANLSDTQIYTLNSSNPDYKIWLEDLKSGHGIGYQMVSDPWMLLNHLKGYIKGYVIYDNVSGNDPSINNACSLASIKQSIAIDASLESKVKSLGITNKMGDCRNTSASWAYDHLWNSGLNHSVVIQLSPGKDTALRDYAIMTKSLVFYEDSKEKVTLRNKVFGSMGPDALCLGWGPDEFVNVSTASRHGVSVVAADWSYNLSVLSAFPSLPVSQGAFAEPRREKGVHYVTFLMSDGDNQQWYLGKNYSSPKWYGAQERGSFNMGWTISPSMFYLTPTVFDLYYKSAKKGTGSDYFLVSPSGRGYMFPSKFPRSDLDNYAKKLNRYMKKVDQKYVAVIDDWALFNRAVWEKYLAQPDIEGLFYLNYSRQDDYKGLMVWAKGKPVVSCRDLLWAGLEEENTLVEKINARVRAGQTDIRKETAYTFVYVHAWSKDMSSIAKVTAQLEKNPKVRVVTPEAFMVLVKRNIK
ncbi:hypothetical protein DCMF_14240 [Candidatus Formimonas warabiya]|uniref:Tyrosine specific protein phosphatases domain-containing protein n=2 Tax=Formimonas warabiya TaxID=1761012 RepID=A0A3G1KTH6_FORW1|nr:hypothetical protein DCMF_14240 [Candidatus Formimonas warabiya]